MAEIRQDLLSLNYSPSFDISGMQEAEVNLSLPPAVVQYVLENGLYRPISYRQKQT